MLSPSVSCFCILGGTLGLDSIERLISGLYDSWTNVWRLLCNPLSSQALESACSVFLDLWATAWKEVALVCPAADFLNAKPLSVWVVFRAEPNLPWLNWILFICLSLLSFLKTCQKFHNSTWTVTEGQHTGDIFLEKSDWQHKKRKGLLAWYEIHSPPSYAKCMGQMEEQIAMNQLPALTFLGQKKKNASKRA